MWEVVWGADLQEGQEGSSARPILSLYVMREEQWPDRSWDNKVRWGRGKSCSSGSISGGCMERTLLGGAELRDSWTAL